MLGVCFLRRWRRSAEVGGFLPHQIVEEIGNVVRPERFSEHIAKQTMEQNVEVRRLLMKEHVEVVSLALHLQIAKKIFVLIVEPPFPNVAELFIACLVAVPVLLSHQWQNSLSHMLLLGQGFFVIFERNC